MIDKNKQYATYIGLPVEIYATDRGGDYSVHGAVFKDGAWRQYSWTCEGKRFPPGSSNFDLVEVNTRIHRTVWLNIYDQETTVHTGKDDADFFAMLDRIACVEIEIDCEEGEGL